MKPTTTLALQNMEVINLCDGAKLGYPCNFEINAENGCVLALCVPKETKWLNVCKPEEYRIPWCRIECFGEETILVKLPPEELSGCLSAGCRPKRRGFLG